MTVTAIRNDGDAVRFGNFTDTWTVTTAAGRCETVRAVIDVRPSAEPAVAVHGIPNYFRVPGPDVDRQQRFVNRCLALFDRSGATRIEAKSRIVLHRWRPNPVAGRFYLTGPTPGDDDVYDGPATLTLPGADVEVRARLTGHLDAIDGQYHWRGTVTGDLPPEVLRGQRAVELAAGGHRARARVVEATPWGGYTLSGVGTPPYSLS